MKLFACFSLVLAWLSAVWADQPMEIGTVRWMRDHDTALKQSKESKKPVFALFQEVPGCAGYKQFGKNVLSEPELVNVIESAFIPLLIHNNKGGHDAELLKGYCEPAWNFQVVRFFDGDGKDIIPRKDRIWDTQSLSRRMIRVLNISQQSVPGTLYELAELEDSGEQTSRSLLQQAAIAQNCFWTGERVIGAIDGVTETEAGFLKGREVKLFHSKQSIRLLRAKEAGDRVYTDLNGYRKAPLRDQKRQIQDTVFSQIKMTNAQSTKVNAWARVDKEKAFSYLTPEQLRTLEH